MLIMFNSDISIYGVIALVLAIISIQFAVVTLLFLFTTLFVLFLKAHIKLIIRFDTGSCLTMAHIHETYKVKS